MTRIRAFTCCDARYLPAAVVALTSVRKWTSGIELCVVSDSYSSEDYVLLER